MDDEQVNVVVPFLDSGKFSRGIRVVSILVLFVPFSARGSDLTSNTVFLMKKSDSFQTKKRCDRILDTLRREMVPRKEQWRMTVRQSVRYSRIVVSGEWSYLER